MTTFAALLAAAGMTEADLPATVHECDEALALLGAEISGIKDQLEAEKAGVSDFGFRTQNWAARAIHAATLKRNQYSAIRRHRNRLRDAAERANREVKAAAAAERKARALDERRSADERSRRRAADHAERTKSEAEALLAAMRRHVATLDRATRDGFYAALEAAQATLREKSDA